jgi:catechol 2,3-dioxygenase-like lactoylglutathione lyase family enzyme
MSSDVGLRAIAGFRIVTTDLDRLTEFYKAIGFDIGETALISSAEMAVLELDGEGSRRSMALGDSRVELDCFEQRGRPYPGGATASDLIFQHLALITDNARAAWRRAQGAGAVSITRGHPVTLPQSSGGVTAIKFRDPEGHPLELLEFPRGSNSAWMGSGIMRIGHSAISVADLATSRRFYEGLNLTQGERTLNQGPTQVALDGLDGVQVDVLAMNPTDAPPHLELLGYRHPVGRLHEPFAANDLAATRIFWHSTRDALLRDPDGHLLQLT